MQILLGLGNPGPHYEHTRHNLGFMVLDELACLHSLNWVTDKASQSLIAKGSDYLLVKPQTYMNNSGKTAASLLRYYHLLPKGLFGTKKDSDLTSVLTVIHDELDLPFGTYKFSTNSGSAGHNGVQSIISHLKTKNFSRVRIGINTLRRKQIPGDKFVLQKFNSSELKTVEKLIPEIISNIKL